MMISSISVDPKSRSFRTRKKSRKKGHPFLLGCISFLFWIAVWEILALIVGKEVLVPSPLLVAKRVISLCGDALFRTSVLFSLLRVLLGFLAGVLFGCLFAVLTSYSKVISSLADPMLNVIRSTPVASFILLALVWINPQILPAFISFLMVLPTVWLNLETGIKETPKVLDEAADVFGASPMQKLRYVSLPSAMPYLMSACRTGFGLAWKSSIAAEVLCFPKNSIGGLLYEAKTGYETTDVFAYTLIVILFSILLEKLFTFLTERIGKRY